MKNVNNFCKLICTIIFAVLLSSCNETNEQHEFSHDETINSWVLKHKHEVVNYDRNKIVTFSAKKQKAIFKSFIFKEKERGVARES